MKYPVKAGRGACFGFVILPALTITKPKDSPSANQFEVATGADNSAFWTMPPKNITVVSKITANTSARILCSFLIWSNL
jgi:hypothetical protein